MYDFRRPTALAREQSRTLELAFETFARQWGTQLTAKVRVRSRVALDQVRLQTYDDYTAGVPTLTTMVLLELPGEAPRAVVQFPAGAALTWIGHMLGATAEQAPDADRELTALEQNLVRRLMSDAVEDLRYSLGDLLTVAPVVRSLRFNAQFAQAAGPNEPMVVAAFTVTFGDRSCPATLALPAAALLPQLGGSVPSVGEHSGNPIAGALELVPLEVSVRLAPVPVRPAQILDLAVGDLIPVPHPRTRPLDVAVDDRVLATAAVGSTGSRLACVIVTTEESNR
ncbi:flagellar motor switch protein FliM [Occultella aeris]|uniref:Flagellar motor switch protein FliM n=1 Tax=Occultella aeris TaxID=2761496 RepID=A0A7M4DDG1_9MICO|nr:flagellar motor switch protein FliM [Occultella aeris]VZO34880.1 Flagellar motor switch protein FliM [Occultella aeris]